jgi:IS5 family transposase
MQRKAGQLSLADGLVKGAKNFLGEADALIDWSEIEQQLEGIYGASTGRPSYPLLTLFKAMLIQQWYGLSDPRAEEAITDSISFRRFVGLSLADPVPDHSTLSRFRTQLGNRFEKLQEAFNRQLDRRGLILRQGTLIDASFVQSSSRQGRVDPEAGRYGRQQEDHVSGYKMHTAVDQCSGLVRKVIVTSANINDTTPADGLILGDEAAVYADRAYDTHERRKNLEQRGVFAGLMHRSSKYHDLSPEQQAFNLQIRPVRAAVERTFGILKMHYRLRRSRYIGLIRTAVQIHLAIMAMNIKRALVLESGGR